MFELQQCPKVCWKSNAKSVLRALYWRSNSENRAVAIARSEIPLFAKSTQGRHFVTVKKQECAENRVFHDLGAAEEALWAV